MFAPATIIGAGLAGALAAHRWPSAQIIEASPEPRETHGALLRFKTDAVTRATGIELKKVRVRKGIVENGTFYATPSIRQENLYSRKVLADRVVSGRSIGASIDVQSERYVPPKDFYWQLIEPLKDRIHWGVAVNALNIDSLPRPIVNTAPLSVILSAVGMQLPAGNPIRSAAVHVQRFDVHGVDLHQTLYFPGNETVVYRASMVGDRLIIEATQEVTNYDVECVLHGFGLRESDLDWSTSESFVQPRGKIEPLADPVRKQILSSLTLRHEIFSLGRFATQRSVVTDDLFSDMDRINAMIKSGSYMVLQQSS